MEFYGIRGFGSLTVKEEAILAAGLPLRSRVKTKKTLGELRFPFDQILLASVLDQLRILNWKMSKKKNAQNFPESVLDKLLEEPKKEDEKDDVASFDSKEAFERRRREIIGGTNAE